jgi:hypothetical protein
VPKIGLALNLAQLSFECVLRRVLHRRIERRVNGKAAIIHLGFSQDEAQAALHSVHRIILLDLWHSLWMRDDFGFFGLLGLCLSNFF